MNFVDQVVKYLYTHHKEYGKHSEEIINDETRFILLTTFHNYYDIDDPFYNVQSVSEYIVSRDNSNTSLNILRRLVKSTLIHLN
jgi:hypothetical protein